MLAELGTWGETHLTSMVSDPTSPNVRSVGAGTAVVKTKENR